MHHTQGHPSSLQKNKNKKQTLMDLRAQVDSNTVIVGSEYTMSPIDHPGK
jgi:hypothetical protein